jgi:hypothetical protein
MDHLDTSWIETEEKMCNNDETCIREPLSDIALFFIYVNENDEIEKITKEIEDIENGRNIITKERILQIVQTKRHIDTSKKYRLFDILSFQIGLEPENLKSFAATDLEGELENQFLKSVPIFDEIMCESSIFIFHDINSLYFIFKETPNYANLKSILKTGGSLPERRITKKVRISGDNVSEPTENENKRKSIKRFMKKLKHTRKVIEK